MSKQGHTAGPLEVGKDINGNYAVFPKGRERGFTAGDIEVKADAILYAAAPELLAALQRAVEYFNENGAEESYTWLAWMKDAINKAEGRA